MKKNNTSDASQDLLDQIREEKSIAEKYMMKKRKRWIRQFKLYDNERINDDMLGDETTYTMADTYMSAISADVLTQEFVPTEEGDEEQCEVLNATATHDARKMQLETVEDYTTAWMTYTGKVVWDVSEFSRKLQCVQPRFINPFLEYPDPDSLLVHGIGTDGSSASRWYGYELPTTRGELEKMKWDVDKKESPAKKDLKVLNKTTRVPHSDIGDNIGINILVWYTHFKGKKWQIITDIECNEILRMNECVLGYFPLVDHPLGVGREWYPRSVFDMVEDKHIKRAEISNAMHEMVIEQLAPIYLAKSGFLRMDQLQSAQAGDVIETDSLDAIRPLQKASISNDAKEMLQVIDAQSQEVTGLPDIQQGVQMDDARTASELSLMSSASKRRYGRIAKLRERSYRAFWTAWYDMNQHFWDLTSKKMIRITGIYGANWRGIRKSDISLSGDLNVQISSKTQNDQKKQSQLNLLLEFHKIASANPQYQVNQGIKMIAKNIDLSTQEINLLLPQSRDEIEAQGENTILAENTLVRDGKTVKFDIYQDHDAHIREHMKGKMTKAMERHIELHWEAKRLMKEQPELSTLGANEIAQQDTQQQNTPNQLSQGIQLPTIS